MSTTWHADVGTLRAYAHGRIDPAGAVSVEAHLLACGRCRGDLAGVSDRDELETLWHAVEDVVDQPTTTGAERLLQALGLPATTAKLVAAAPAVRVSWILALVAVIGCGVLATYTNHGDPIAYLWLAPLVPIAGVATAYGPGIDPIFEIGVASPIDGLRLLLIRVVAVEVVALTLLLTATLALPHLDALDFAWLLPALAVSIVTLALGTYVGMARASVLVGVAWFVLIPIFVWLAQPGTGAVASDLAVFDLRGQLVSVLAAGIGATVFMLRRRRFDAPVTGRDLT